MDVKDLRYFIAVYETKGFSRASFQLGTVQSNVSARIRGLEKFLGVELFERHPFGIVPTRKGEALYVQAKPLLASIQQAEQSIRLATP